MTTVSRDRNAALGHDRGHEAIRGTRGLLHDLGHQLMTLSLLAESVRRDDDIPAESRRRIELVKQEVVRALDMITDYLAGEDPRPAATGSDRLDIRDLAGQSAKLAELAYGARVELLPGRPVIVRIRPAVAWRVLSNLVDNAARSAGPGGRVQVSVRQEIDTNGGYGGSPPRANTVIEVLDDGQGIGRAPGGMAGMGLSVVRQLVDAAEGRLEVSDRADGGTRARVVFCPQRERAIMPRHAGPWR
jgi:signal transduction histidine kinase